MNRTRAASGAEGQSDRTRERLWVREGEEKRKEKRNKIEHKIEKEERGNMERRKSIRRRKPKRGREGRELVKETFKVFAPEVGWANMDEIAASMATHVSNACGASAVRNR